MTVRDSLSEKFLSFQSCLASVLTVCVLLTQTKAEQNQVDLS